MLFFKRILNVKKAVAPSERRGGGRYAVLPDFPIKTVLNIAGRDEQGQIIKGRDGQGWDWTGQLVNLSASGARIQVPRTLEVLPGDTCTLKIDVQGFELAVPGRIAHRAERRDALVLGVALEIETSPARLAYRQLVELIALGATLKREKPLQPDGTGYLAEQYAGEPASRLVVWRHLVGREIAAFEFQLKDCTVRGLTEGTHLQCFTGSGTTARPATGTKGEEILRLYQWVVLNLAPAVPADVRAFLQQHSA